MGTFTKKDRQSYALLMGIVMLVVAIIFAFFAIFGSVNLKDKDFVTIKGSIENCYDRERNRMFLIRLQGDSSIYAIKYYNLSVETITIITEKCTQGSEIEIICYATNAYVHDDESDDLKNNQWYIVEDLKINGVQYKTLEESIEQSELEDKDGKNFNISCSVLCAIPGVFFLIVYFVWKKKL